MTQLVRHNADRGFNLSIEEVRIIAKLRQLADHQRRGVLQALETMRPSRNRSLTNMERH